MRTTSLVAGMAFVLVSCGGGVKKSEEQPPAPPEEQQPAPVVSAPRAGPKTHDVKMVLDGSSYRYVPDALIIKAGDVVRFLNKSGGPHNVSFWPDSIPRGGAAALQSGMPSQSAPLEGPLLVDPEAVYEVSFVGAPPGVYRFYCLPHVAMGMSGYLTVE
jgi:plastocyanin